MKLHYDLWYRLGTPPWVGPARSELVNLVETGVLTPGRAVDLGCGEGDNAIFLAQHGFDVTALDSAPAALAKARVKAREAGVEVDFIVDDLTHLRMVTGTFDVIVDYGTFDDLSPRNRKSYVEQVVPLAKPGARFLLWCFEWHPRPFERLVLAVLRFTGIMLRPGEVQRWFAPHFEIERIAGETSLDTWPRGWAAYLMTRRSV